MTWTDERAREVLRATAAAGFVLARNEHSLLPLDRRALRRVAVIGPNAAMPRTLGGGSATVFPAYRVSPLDGLSAALAPDVTIGYSPGVRSHTRIPLARPSLLYLPGGAEPGTLVEFVAEGGTVLHTEHRLGGFYIWRSLPEAARDVPFAAVRVTTTLRAPAAGTYLIGCSGHGRFRLTLAGELAFDRYLDACPRRPTRRKATSGRRSIRAAVSLHAGQSIDVVLEYRTGGPGDQTSFVLGGVSFQLNIEEPYLPDDEEIARAVLLAEAADVAVVVVGTTEEAESEGFDRATLEPARPARRTGAPDRRGEPADGRGRQYRGPGAAAMGGHRARRSADHVSRAGVRQRAGGCAARPVRTRRTAARHLAGVTRRPSRDQARAAS